MRSKQHHQEHLMAFRIQAKEIPSQQMTMESATKCVHDKHTLPSLENLRSVVGVHNGSWGFNSKPATEPRWVDRDAATMASVAPTAMPTSAADSAARSLMPSPQNSVVLPRPCNDNTNNDSNVTVSVISKSGCSHCIQVMDAIPTKGLVCPGPAVTLLMVRTLVLSVTIVTVALILTTTTKCFNSSCSLHA